MLVLAEDVLSKRAPIIDVILLIIYSLPAIIALTFPFASLVGALMGISRLSSDNEILAFLASGIPLRRLFLPMFVISIFLSVVSFTMNDYFLPKGTINYIKLYRELIYSHPELELESYTVKKYKDSTLITGSVADNTINDMLIIDSKEGGEKRVITADKAYLLKNREEGDIISLLLDDVTGHTSYYEKKEGFDYFSSKNMEYNILLGSVSYSMGSLGPREMSSIDVYREIQEKKKNLQSKRIEHDREIAQQYYNMLQVYKSVLLKRQSPYPSSESIDTLNNLKSDIENMKNRDLKTRSLHIYQIEFYKKFSIPFACLAFIFFAFPTGLFSKRSGRTVGFGIGLIVSVLYWGMLFAGQTLGFRLDTPPALTMWIPNILIITVGLILMGVKYQK